LKYRDFESLFSPNLGSLFSKNMKPTYYSEISEGASFVQHHVVEAAKENLEIKILYKGCQLLFSPLMERPKILLVDFIPGSGYYNWHGKIVEEFQSVKALEYYLITHPLEE
jgi:hypothetical protein